MKTKAKILIKINLKEMKLKKNLKNMNGQYNNNKKF